MTIPLIPNSGNQEVPPTENVVATNQPTLSQADVDARIQSQQALYNSALAEQQRRIQMQEIELQEIRARQQNPQPNYQQLNEQFISNPTEVTEQIVARQMQAQMAPVVNKFEQFMRTQSYQTAKNAFRGMPNWNLVEGQIDQYFAMNPNVEPTQSTIQALFQMFIGQLAMNNPAALQPRTQQNIIPAQLSPSTPAVPTPASAEPWNQMTELQKQLAKENKMTLKDYWMLLNADQREFMNVDPTWRNK